MNVTCQMSWEASTRYWYQFTKSYRSSSIINKEDTFQQIFNSLQSTDKDLITAKIHLLSFIQQQGTTFINEPTKVHQIIDLLNTQLIELPCSNPLQVQLTQQIMVTICTLLILFEDECFDSPSRQNYLEEFINTLLEIIRGSITASKLGDNDSDTQTPTGSFRDISQSFERGLVEVAAKTGIHIGGIQGKSQERSLRLYAAETLLELEENFPGLLQYHYKEILSLSQYEITHASQSYVLLASTILSNATEDIYLTNQTQNLSSSKSIKEYIFPLPYNILGTPPKFKLTKNLKENQPSPPPIHSKQLEAKEKELKRVIIYFHNSLEYMSSWGAISTTQKILRILKRENISMNRIFDELLNRLQKTNFLPFTHLIIQLYRQFSSVFGYHKTAIKDQILRFVDCTALSSPSEQSLVLMWCIELFDEFFDNSSNLEAVFYPHSFDRLTVRSRKLLLRYQSKFLQQQSNLKNSTNEIKISKNIFLQDINTLESFRYYPSTHYFSHCILDVLRLIISLYPNSIIFINEFIRNLLIENPRFSNFSLYLLDSQYFPLSKTMETKILNVLYDLLLNNVKSNKMIEYLPILEYLLSLHSIDPLPLLNYVLEMLKNSDLLSNSWNLGNQLFLLFRKVIFIHQPSKFFTSLCNILNYMSQFFGDLDIRERAHFYLGLVTNLPHDMLKIIFSHSSLTKLENALNFPTPPVFSASDDSLNITDQIQSNFAPFSLHLSLNTTKKYENKKKLILPLNVKEQQEFQSEEEKIHFLWENYWNDIKSNFLFHSIFIDIQIKFDENSDKQKPNLYSVNVYISPESEETKNQFNLFPVIHIPILSQKISKFTSELTYSPKKPIPTNLSVLIHYQDENNDFKEVLLDPISLTFEDLLFPCNFPSEIENSFDVSSEKLTSVFFPLLFGKISEQELYGESLRVFQISKDKILKKILECELLNSLRIENDNVEENSKTIQFLGYLLPHFHLLMQFNIFENHCNVYLHCDYWPILSFVECFLNKIFLEE